MSGFLIGFLLFMCVALIIGYHSKNQECEELKQNIATLQDQLAEQPQPAQSGEEESDAAGFVRTRQLRPASPETYRNVFDIDLNGQRVLDHLEMVFAKKSAYVRGGQDAERESCFRAGQAHVIGFIFNQINKANNPEMYKEEANDSATE